MRHTEYKNKFLGWIQRHKELKAQGFAFSQMHLSANPLQQQLDLTEFLTSLRNKRGTQVVLQSFFADYSGGNGDNTSRMLHGALLVLDKVGTDDWEKQGQVYDNTERIAEEIIAAVRQELNESYKYLMQTGDLQAEKIGPVQGFHGTRLNFSIKQLAVPSLYYKQDKFLTPNNGLPYTLPFSLIQ